MADVLQAETWPPRLSEVSSARASVLHSMEASAIPVKGSQHLCRLLHAESRQCMLIHTRVHMALCTPGRYHPLWRQLLRLQEVEVQLYEVWPQLWQLTGSQTWQQCKHSSLDWRQRT